MKADPRYAIFAARAVFDERLTAIDVRVLAALGTETDRQGWVRMSQGEIADRLNVHRVSINRCVKRLVEFGYVQHVTQTLSKMGKTASLYRVLTDLSAPEVVIEAAEPATDAMLHKATSVPSDVTTDVATHVTTDVTTDVAATHTDVTLGLQHIRPVIPPSETSSLQCPKEPVVEKTRGKRLPASWQPRQDELIFGIAGGLTEAEVNGCAAHFRDHFEASTLATARKLDWDKAFRNWLRTAISDAKRGRRPVSITTTQGQSGNWSPERRMQHFLETGEWRPHWGPKPDGDLFSASAGAAK